MSYIIEIKKLKNQYDHSINGYVGINIKTGKIHYYSMYDRNGTFLNGKLIEFDKTKIIDKRNRLCTNYEEKNLTTQIDNTKLNIIINEIIKMHLNHNIKKNFEIHSLNENYKKLMLKYENNNSIIGSNSYLGKYTPVENSIKLSPTIYNQIEENKQEVLDTLLHEIGHMKASKVFRKNKQIIIKTGFYTNTIKTSNIKLYNGDIFQKVSKIYDNKQNIKSRIIEEIMNEYDIKQIKPDYKTSYPNIGHILNYLCDYRLEYARYKENGINILYNSLLKTINDENLIDELFENLLELEEYYRWNIKPKNNDAIKILKKYAIEKSKML